MSALRNLLARSWGDLLAALRTSTLSVSLFTFIIPGIGFLVALIPDIWHRKTGVTVTSIVLAAAVSQQVIISILLTVILWILLIGWFILKRVLGYQISLRY